MKTRRRNHTHEGTSSHNISELATTKNIINRLSYKLYLATPGDKGGLVTSTDTVATALMPPSTWIISAEKASSKITSSRETSSGKSSIRRTTRKKTAAVITSTEKTSTGKSSTGKTSTRRTSTRRTSTEKASTRRTSTDKTSTRKTSTGKISTRRTSTRGTSTERTSTRRTSTRKTSTRGTSTERTSTRRTSTVTTSREKTSTRRTSAEKTSTRRTSTRRTSTGKTSTWTYSTRRTSTGKACTIKTYTGKTSVCRPGMDYYDFASSEEALKLVLSPSRKHKFYPQLKNKDTTVKSPKWEAPKSKDTVRQTKKCPVRPQKNKPEKVIIGRRYAEKRMATQTPSGEPLTRKRVYTSTLPLNRRVSFGIDSFVKNGLSGSLTDSGVLVAPPGFRNLKITSTPNTAPMTTDNVLIKALKSSSMTSSNDSCFGFSNILSPLSLVSPVRMVTSTDEGISSAAKSSSSRYSSTDVRSPSIDRPATATVVDPRLQPDMMDVIYSPVYGKTSKSRGLSIGGLPILVKKTKPCRKAGLSSSTVDVWASAINQQLEEIEQFELSIE